MDLPEKIKSSKINSFFLIYIYIDGFLLGFVPTFFFWSFSTIRKKDVFFGHERSRICHQQRYATLFRSSERCLVDGTVIPKLLGFEEFGGLKNCANGTGTPETNSSHLKMDGWNTTFLSGWTIFRCHVSFRECKDYPWVTPVSYSHT